jgi:hypothetical protein
VVGGFAEEFDAKMAFSVFVFVNIPVCMDVFGYSKAKSDLREF